MLVKFRFEIPIICWAKNLMAILFSRTLYIYELWLRIWACIICL